MRWTLRTRILLSVGVVIFLIQWASTGSHGRGFAVAADEIRNLAHGVSASTKDTASIVQSLQQDAKQGMEHIRQAHSALTRILDSAQRSSSVVSNIAEMLHQLKNSTRDVSGAMDQSGQSDDE